MGKETFGTLVVAYANGDSLELPGVRLAEYTGLCEAVAKAQELIRQHQETAAIMDRLGDAAAGVNLPALLVSDMSWPVLSYRLDGNGKPWRTTTAQLSGDAEIILAGVTSCDLVNRTKAKPDVVPEQ